MMSLAVFHSLTTVLLTALHSASASAILPRSPGATISLDAVSGNGCPKGSVTLEDLRGDAARLTFQQFDTAVSGTRTKNCALNIKIDHAAGYRVAVDHSRYEGRSELSAGATMTSYTTFYFASNPAASATTDEKLQGPGGGSYVLPVDIESSNRAYTACGATSAMLIMTTRQALGTSDGAASGSASLVTQVVELDWVAC